ncbi:peptidase M43 family protein [Metarhizium robertsii]|uniref:Peptidase M43 family protein n=1 Tax=Metarhizium robertsii TaxID=568076 RepID=A0A014PGU7_9HYPO|nr:peptidase M43 family protein [Metarhizium robertsii]
MYFLPFVIVILMANIVKTSAIHTHNNEALAECAEEEPSPEFLQFSKSLQASNSSLARRQTQQNFNFRVFAHVVYYDKTPRGGFVEDWATLKDEQAMKNELRGGGYADLNLYYISSIDNERGNTYTVGTCSFPTIFLDNRGRPIDISHITTHDDNKMSEDDVRSDGCMIVARAVNDRITTTHEVGHWLGLLHTWNTDCNSGGDMVNDTPLQQSPTKECSAVKYRFPDGTPANYACGDWRGSNMENFMDYSDCGSTFTAGQKDRMKDFARYRQILEAREPTHHSSRPAAPAPAPEPPSDANEGNTQRLPWFEPNIFAQEGGRRLCTDLAKFKLSGPNSLSADVIEIACGTEMFCKFIAWDWNKLGPQTIRDRLGFASYDECIAGHEAGRLIHGHPDFASSLDGIGRS